MHHLFTMNFKPVAAAIALCALALPARAQQPSAAEILAGTRMAATLAQLDKGLAGNLRQGNRKIPVVLYLKGGDIQFQFSEGGGPWQIFHMRIGDDKLSLYEMSAGKQRDFPAAKLVSPVAGTDLTYEDLALRFLYWPNPKLEGTEKVGGQECYKIRIDKPAGAAGRYQVVYVWAHTKFGAFMRIRGHDQKGGLLKEFQVEDIMQVAKDTWTLRKMQVSTHNPTNGRRTSITDVTFDSPRKAGPRGLR